MKIHYQPWLYLCLKTTFFIVYTNLQEQRVTDILENAELWFAKTPDTLDTSFKK